MGTEKEKGESGREDDALKTAQIAFLLNVDLEKRIRNLLQLAARALNSEEASILLKDASTGDLRFLKATGQVGDQLEGVVIPAGKGIASFVASSGQPMVISDVGQEASFYAEIDKKTGFSTELLLATPLIDDDEIIGVLEIVNRIGEPPYDPFTPDEMDRAAIFAEGIAALVGAMLASGMSDGLSGKILEGTVSSDLDGQRKWIAGQTGDREHKELLDLTVLLKEVAGRGSAQRKLCRQLLESLLEFAGETEGQDFSDV